MDTTEKSKKPFSVVDITFLLIVALMNDAFTVFAALIFLVPGIGQIVGGLAELFNVFIWAIITFWFIIRLRSFGAPVLLQTAGGVAEFFGVPGRTATVLAGIVIGNNPKLATAAALASGAAAAGAATRAGATTTRTAGAATRASSAEEAFAGRKVAAGGGQTSAGVARETTKTGERTPIEKIRETMEKIPEPEEKRRIEDGDEEIEEENLKMAA